MFTAALLTFSQDMKAKCPSMKKWVMKSRYIYHGILFNHKTQGNSAIYDKLEGIMLIEINQIEYK